MSTSLSFIFPTPFSQRIVDDAAALNDGLERAILARYEKRGGNRISNVGGWQSEPDFLQWPEPEIRKLAAEIDASVQEIWTVPVLLKQVRKEDHVPAIFWSSGWANVNHAGDFNRMHMHPGHHLAAVYYVSTGNVAPNQPMDGRLELRDPRPNALYCNRGGPVSGGSMLIEPKAGMLVVFPAWMEHAVHPFQGSGKRISIAVNISVNNAP